MAEDTPQTSGSVPAVIKTTIRLTEALAVAVKREANAAGIYESEFMRLAIAHYLGYLEGLREEPRDNDGWIADEP